MDEVKKPKKHKLTEEEQWAKLALVKEIPVGIFSS